MGLEVCARRPVCVDVLCDMYLKKHALFPILAWLGLG